MVTSYNELPLELTAKIADYLDFNNDLKSFGQVCSSWRTAMKLSPRYAASCKAPWLMKPLLEGRLFDETATKLRAGWIFDRRSIRHVHLPSFEVDTKYKRRHVSSCRGWLVIVDDCEGRKDISLVHPFTGDAIRIPQLPKQLLTRVICSSLLCNDRFFYAEVRVALSGCPITSKYYTLAITFANNANDCYTQVQDVCFWNSRDKEWVVYMDHPCIPYVFDITFYKGQFYIVVINNDNDHIDDDNYNDINYYANNVTMVVASEFGTAIRAVSIRLEPTCELQYQVSYSVYLVESSGVLLQVVHYISTLFNVAGSSSFQVFEVDVDNWRTKEVKSLGNRTLFVSLYSSFSMEASAYYCQPNCIYFVNEIRGEHNMCVYDLTCGQIIEDRFNPSLLRDVWNGSLWVEPLTSKTTLSLPLNRLHFYSPSYKDQVINITWDFIRFIRTYVSMLSFLYNIYLLVKTKGTQLLNKWKLRGGIK